VFNAIRSVIEQNPDMPPEIRDAITRRGAAGAAMGIGALVFFVIGICVNCVFGTVGGMIGAALFKGGKPAVLPAEPPPPPPPPL
jgi:hypothetical protein